jgi:carotenoid cleavage dioxygenase-like enzyme
LAEPFEAVGLKVEGRLPEWLSGVLVRNGHGRWDHGGGKGLRHWFDGLAMLPRFSFGGCEVSYAGIFRPRVVAATRDLGR